MVSPMESPGPFRGGGHGHQESRRAHVSKRRRVPSLVTSGITESSVDICQSWVIYLTINGCVLSWFWSIIVYTACITIILSSKMREQGVVPIRSPVVSWILASSGGLGHQSYHPAAFPRGFVQVASPAHNRGGGISGCITQLFVSWYPAKSVCPHVAFRLPEPRVVARWIGGGSMATFYGGWPRP